MRPIGGAVHQLTWKSRLNRPATLEVGVTCPGLVDPGPWRSQPEGPAPNFDARTGRLTWTVSLPEGDAERVWTWG